MGEDSSFESILWSFLQASRQSVERKKEVLRITVANRTELTASAVVVVVEHGHINAIVVFVVTFFAEKLDHRLGGDFDLFHAG